MAGGWDSIGLLPELVRTVEDDFHWSLPTAIQDECIPIILGGGDVMASAETGSGKTAAFAIPICQLCYEAKTIPNQRHHTYTTDTADSWNHATPTGIQEESVLEKHHDDTQSINTTGKSKQRKSLVIKFRMSGQDRHPSIAIDPESLGLRLQSRIGPKSWAGCRCSSGILLGKILTKNIMTTTTRATTSKTKPSPPENYYFSGQPYELNYYYECTVLKTYHGGIVRVGWSSADAHLDLGTDEFGYGYGGTGMKGTQNRFERYPNGDTAPVSFGEDDVIGCYLKLIVPAPSSTDSLFNDPPPTTTQRRHHRHHNADANKTNTVVALVALSFSKNGTHLGLAFSIHITEIMIQNHFALFPTVCMKNSECEMNFGDDLEQNPFRFPPIAPHEEDHDDESASHVVQSDNHHSLPSVRRKYHPLASLNRIEIGGTVNPKDVSIASLEGDDDNDDIDGATGTVEATDYDGGRNRTRPMAGLLAIVLEPTRDLAEQTFRVFDDLTRRLVDPNQSTSTKSLLQVALLVGGVKNKVVESKLRKNQVDILVGTPPIIASYMIKGKIKSLQHCQRLVLDEADELILQRGNRENMMEHMNVIFSRLLAANALRRFGYHRLQVCFFSATLHHPAVKELANKLCWYPQWVDLRGKEDDPNDSILPDTIHHCMIMIDPSIHQEMSHVGDDDVAPSMVTTDAVHRGGKLHSSSVVWKDLSEKEANSERIKLLKPRIVLDLLERFAMTQVLIFCRTNLDCDLLEKWFHRQCRGSGDVSSNIGLNDRYSCRVLAGMRSMLERQEALQEFRQGNVRILIATDVAARGIDIPYLPFVLHMTLPDTPETYIHRSGRVGRVDRIGLSISLVSTLPERVWFCQSGRKPPCSDTRDYAKGGNCIWYQELKYYLAIEARLQQNPNVGITKVPWRKGMEMPALIQSMLDRGGYGESVDQLESAATVDPNLLQTMQVLQERVRQVECTESSLQCDFWKLRSLSLSS